MGPTSHLEVENRGPAGRGWLSGRGGRHVGAATGHKTGDLEEATGAGAGPQIRESDAILATVDSTSRQVGDWPGKSGESPIMASISPSVSKRQHPRPLKSL